MFCETELEAYNNAVLNSRSSCYADKYVLQRLEIVEKEKICYTCRKNKIHENVSKKARMSHYVLLISFVKYVIHVTIRLPLSGPVLTMLLKVKWDSISTLLFSHPMFISKTMSLCCI